MTEADKRQVLQMIGDAKEELRDYIRDISNKHTDAQFRLASDISDNVDAILEIGSIVGEN